MKVREAMTKAVSTASRQERLLKVAQMMKAEDTGFIPVVDGESLVGVITDRDIVLRCLAEGHSDILNESVEHCMSANAVTVDPDADLSEAARLMEDREIRRLAVVQNGRLVGVLSHGNLVQATQANGPGDTATLGVTKGA